LWSTTAVSCTVPIISPASTTSPTFAVALNSHTFVLFNDLTATPFLRKWEFAASCIALSGLWIPSNIDSINPGPSSILNGSPVVITGSPGPIPEVSS